MLNGYINFFFLLGYSVYTETEQGCVIVEVLES